LPSRLPSNSDEDEVRSQQDVTNWHTKETRMEAIGRLEWIQIDCLDPRRLALFWGTVLGLEIDSTLGEPAHYVGLAKAGPDHPHVYFQRVSEPKTLKNRLHLDIRIDDIEQATARIETLGGRRLPVQDFREHGFRWRVMADPEGNEFCLVYGQPTG
jgi:predicted enzyme related to lactoylglutathione lyase